MRALGRSVLAFGAAVLLASPALAQPGRGGGMMGGLIGNKSVQEELKLSTEQVEKVTALTTSLREKMQPEMEKARDLPDSERREKMTELMRTAREDTNKGLKDILKPEQLKRYREIDLQTRGFEAIASDKEVQEKLNITADQKDKLKALQEEYASSQREIFQGGFSPETRTKMQALRKETNDKATALLTEDQKKTWKEMTGEPFTVRFEPPRQRPNQ
jgi:Spy/CpxP family protein refolding chaperone